MKKMNVKFILFSLLTLTTVTLACGFDGCGRRPGSVSQAEQISAHGHMISGRYTDL